MCKKKFNQLGDAFNANERFLLGICERLEYIAELLESEEEVKKVVEEVKKPAPRKRKTVTKEG